jgi:hypothetical protein
MSTVKKVTVGNKVVRIIQDSCNESPREWCNLATMVFAGKHKGLGDDHQVDFSEGFNSRQDIITRGEELVRKQMKDVAVCIPVHMYDHGNVSISTNSGYPYDCRWDSGTVGFVVVTKSAIRENFGAKRVTQKLIDRATQIAEGEVETLSNYIRGDVYGFDIKDIEGNQIDSCYGFYGVNFETNGMKDYLETELFEALMETV